MGKVHHWKHGWIPLDAFAQKIAGNGGNGRPELPAPNQVDEKFKVTRGAYGRRDLRDHLSQIASTPDTAYSPTMGVVTYKNLLNYRKQIGMPDKIDGLHLLNTNLDATTAEDSLQQEAQIQQAWIKAGGVLDKAKAAEPNVTPGLVRAAALNGGHMQGLDHKLKGQDSLTRKIYTKSAAKGMTMDQYSAKIGDALRYTFIAPDNNYAGSSQKMLDGLREQGYTVQVENTWNGSEYKGVNANVTKDGFTYELQLHTDSSFRVKMAQHGDYEIARAADATPEMRAAAVQRMVLNMQTLSTPSGAASIH